MLLEQRLVCDQVRLRMVTLKRAGGLSSTSYTAQNLMVFVRDEGTLATGLRLLLNLRRQVILLRGYVSFMHFLHLLGDLLSSHDNIGCRIWRIWRCSALVCRAMVTALRQIILLMNSIACISAWRRVMHGWLMSSRWLGRVVAMLMAILTTMLHDIAWLDDGCCRSLVMSHTRLSLSSLWFRTGFESTSRRGTGLSDSRIASPMTTSAGRCANKWSCGLIHYISLICIPFRLKEHIVTW